MSHFGSCRMVLAAAGKSRSTARLRQDWNLIMANRSALAGMPEIDHRIGQGLERVAHLTEPIEAAAASAEPCPPRQTSVRWSGTARRNRRIEQRLATAVGLLSAASIGVDVGDHAAV